MDDSSPPPPSTPSVPYASPAVPKSGRPVSVIVLSVIGLLIGAMLLLCAPLTLVSMVVDFGVPNPQLDAVRSDPVLKAWTWYGAASMLVFGAWGLIGSIGSLVMKRWGRSTMVSYAIVETTLSIAGAVMTFAVIQPRMVAAMGNQGAVQPPAWTSYIQIGFTALLIGYFICIWYFFTRPTVIDAFEAAEAGAL